MSKALVTEEPRFMHDCSNCIFLGRFEEYDLYFCEQFADKRNPTVIARWSSVGSNYLSGLLAAGEGGMDSLVEAKRRAISLNLLKEEEC